MFVVLERGLGIFFSLDPSQRPDIFATFAT